MQCPSCSQQVPDGSIVCSFCATPLDDAVTSASSGGDQVTTPLSLSDSGQHGRFLPGTTVAGRYRVVGLLGRGGMGEVYRADDLKLGQQVALKFLPRKLMEDEGHVSRLLDEVRMARKVSHPNVCRVWDIGETEGQHYVSMEYVDGEDLASLLRRIGRLPKDKAVEISRQLCAALAAAHDEGVLHRDLKPANIMLDGRGRVKLTDFGLAAVAEVQAGTPIYMAPEQLAGEEVSTRSDLYALGLVLHELFTGKRVFDAGNLDDLRRQHERSMTGSLSTTSDLDPAVDRVIQRCLSPAPKDRPRSALAVAAGLPGADPLAAALAAGETPSPEMVAEAGGEGKLPAVVAVPLLAVAIIASLGYAALMSSRSLVGYVPFDTPPAVLDARAREILEDIGYVTPPEDTAYGFSQQFNRFRAWLADADTSPARWELLREGRPPVVIFWWRGSPRQMRGATDSPAPPRARFSVPPLSLTGMTRLELDLRGNLVSLDVVPARRSPEPGESPPVVDWSVLFDAAGLDIEQFERVDPDFTPLNFADTRAAWMGAWPVGPPAELRVEAASLAGRAVSWRMFSPWDPLPTADLAASEELSWIGFLLVLLLMGMIWTVIFGGIYVALRNVRLGRGDRVGATRLARVAAVAIVLSWIVATYGRVLITNGVTALLAGMAWGAAIGGLVWAFYLAVEPVMRRRDPHTIIGWTRLLDGRFADPLVGRDVLLGCAAGGLSTFWSYGLLAPLVGRAEPEPLNISSWFDLGSRMGVVSSLLNFGGAALMFTFGFFVLYLLFTGIFRRKWVTVGAMATAYLVVQLTVLNSTDPLRAPFEAAWVFLCLVFLVRFGLLPFFIAMMTSFLLTEFAVTLDLSVWYAGNVIIALGLFIGMAAYGFYRSVDWRYGLPDVFGDT